MVRQEWSQQRLPWEDRFNRPNPRQLRKALPTSSGALFDAAIAAFEVILGTRQRVAWLGECWKWSVVFPQRGRKSDELAVIIPRPDDLQIAMRVEPDFIASVWDRRMRRAVRDGLGLAAEPFDTQWSVWPIGSRSVLDEVVRLARSNVDHRREAARS